MSVIKYDTIKSVRDAVAASRAAGLTIGMVPTMGAIHKGHINLMERSVSENGLTVVSVFVNPMQFGDGEDFAKYPRTLDADVAACENAGVDIVFIPKASEIYPEDFSSYVDMSGMTDILCGYNRPNHFRGVMTVVSKLFNIVTPDRAYFGEKDAQQLAIIKKMVWDLNMNTEVIGCTTVREQDGLAMSSRNAYLSAEERKAAQCLYRALRKAEEMSGGIDVKAPEIAYEVRLIIKSEPLAVVEYVEVLDAETLSKVTSNTENALIAVAVNIGKTRLIDNITIRWIK